MAMNREILTPIDDVWQTTIDEVVTENVLLKTRVRSLESDVQTYRTLVSLALAELQERKRDAIWAEEIRRGVYHDDRGLTADERQWAA
jgi:hypothetical protein